VLAADRFDRSDNSDPRPVDVERERMTGQFVRRSQEGGSALPDSVRTRLESTFAVDLSDVRVHQHDVDHLLTASMGADAATVGTHVFFAAGQYQPETPEGLWLLSHEVAHVVQQRTGSVDPQCGDPAELSRWERAADRAADAVLRGELVGLSGTEVDRPQRRPVVMLQAHDSFEHRALGDVPTSDLVAVSAGSTRKVEVLERQIKLLYLWHQNPEAVTAQQVAAICPWIRTIRLEASGLLVTLGELNALPDYIATGQVADDISAEVLLPILQLIRQQGYNQLNKLLNRSTSETFEDSVMGPGIPFFSMLNKILESKKMDDLTHNLGFKNTDHYLAVLARNACHFAPFSWHRWQAPHLLARSYATEAHATSDPGSKARLTHQAWVQAGYADHFLQDSFAAGHLVNKTLIMQWFIEWAAGQQLVPVADWDVVKLSTTKLQPGLAGRKLYDPSYDGRSNDPQTAEDQISFAERLATTGVVPNANIPLNTAYQNYLVFLTSLITQSASAVIHDYYNEHSLWVASNAHPAAYEVWGDDTLFSGANGSEGVSETSGTSQLSQQAINEILLTGATTITAGSIRNHFPTSVRVSGDQLIGIENWNDTQKEFCEQNVFPGLHDIIVRLLSPRAQNVSRDQDLTPQWSASLPGAGFEVTSVVETAAGLFSASQARVYRLDPKTGSTISQINLAATAGETRLVTLGGDLYAAVSGIVAKIAGDWSGSDWSVPLPKAKGVVELLASGGHLFAASNGYVYELDPANGAVIHSLLVASRFGTGDYTSQLTVNGSQLILGAHGYVYSVLLSDWTKAQWSASLPSAGYHPVDVVGAGTEIFAGSNGRVLSLDAASGAVKENLLVTSSVGVGDYTTRLGLDGSSLFVGVHGYVYCVDTTSWSQVKWTASLPSARYTVVNLASFDDQLLAASYGYLYRLDPADGRVVRQLLLTSIVGVGDYETRIVPDAAVDTVFVGTHGYDYAVTINDNPSPSAGHWELEPGQATEISVGADGTAWVVNSADQIYYWNGTTWEMVDGALTRIAVGPDGLPWGINSAGQIWRREGASVPGTGWELMPGLATEISVGADGTAWVVNSAGSIYYWDGTTWAITDGALTRIAAGPNGLPWGINGAGQIWRRTGTSIPGAGWELMPGQATEIAVGGDIAPWVVNADGQVYYWDGATWEVVDGALTRIAVGPNGLPWGINAAGQIWRRRYSTELSGSA